MNRGRSRTRSQDDKKTTSKKNKKGGRGGGGGGGGGDTDAVAVALPSNLSLSGSGGGFGSGAVSDGGGGGADGNGNGNGNDGQQRRIFRAGRRPKNKNKNKSNKTTRSTSQDSSQNSYQSYGRGTTTAMTTTANNPSTRVLTGNSVGVGYDSDNSSYQHVSTFREPPSHITSTGGGGAGGAGAAYGRHNMSDITGGYTPSDDGSSINSMSFISSPKPSRNNNNKKKKAKKGGFRNFFPPIGGGGGGGRNGGNGGGGSASRGSDSVSSNSNTNDNGRPPKELEYNSSEFPYSNINPIPFPPPPPSNNNNQYFNQAPLSSNNNNNNNNNNKQREHALSYGGGSTSGDGNNITAQAQAHSSAAAAAAAAASRMRNNNTRTQSTSRSDHLQIHDKDNGESNSDSSYDDEFFLGDNDNNNNNNNNHEPDIPDYSSGSLQHQKDLASLNLNQIEKITRKNSASSVNSEDFNNVEKFQVKPDYAYRGQQNGLLTRKQLRQEMNTKSNYYHDMRLLSEQKKEIGQLHLEVLQCFGLPTSSLIKEVSAYSVAVHGHSAFQTDIIPNNANPMWLSKMRRACLFPIRETYSKLYIGIFDLEATIEAPPETIKGHPGHPGWMSSSATATGDQHQQFHNHGGSTPRRSSNDGPRRSSGGGGANPTNTPRRTSNDGPRRSSGGHWNDNADDDDDDDLGPQPAPYCTKAEDFIGHVIIDICRLRPGSTYDVTLPLRRSTQVFTREPQGSVRVRIHLNYYSERSAVLSYLPKSLPGGTVIMQKQPNMRYTVNCVDDRSARNVAHAVHGIHMSGKFNLDLVKSTIREINWTRIHILRYLRKRELYQLTTWVYPSISGFVFLAWMHGVYANTVRYVPGHIVVFLLLHLIKNYAYYAMDSPLQNGFLGPTIEELYWALMRGTKKRTSKNKNPFIEPLTVERDVFGSETELTMSGMHGAGTDVHANGGGGAGIANKNLKLMDELYDENGNLVHASRVPLNEIADSMRKSLKVQSHRKGFHVFKHSFQGDNAIDFLCEHGYAFTRPEAVQLGRRLQNEKRLFQHISEGEHFSFEDAPYVYHFLEYDSQRYVIKKSHVPKGGRILELLGFYSRGGHGNSGDNDSNSKGKGGDSNKSNKRRVVGGADILESREHVEFPFSTGVDHPRFTVKESLVIRSIEAKEKLRREEEAKAMVEVAEFGIVPTNSFTVGNNINNNTTTTPGNTASRVHNGCASGYDSERDTASSIRGSLFRSSVGNGSVVATSVGSVDDVRRGYGYNNDAAQQIGGAAADGARLVGRTVRRGSLLVGTAVTSVATTVAAGAGAVTQNLTDTLTGSTRGGHQISAGTMLEVATNEEMYKKLRQQNNAELDKVLELQRQADEYDPYAYDSDTDVGIVHQRKRKKFIIVEKHLKKPMTQEISGNTGVTQVDMSLAKALQKARRQVNALFYHMFDDQVYKIDKNLFPTRLDEKTEKDILDARKKKKKRGLFNRRVSAQELQEEEERHKRLQLTPYERRQDEMDKVLLINQYSHSNPWINRVAIVIQPLVEMSQTFLFAIRALFNVFTWQDPVLCFWLCFLLPILALVLYIAPYRVLFFLSGIYIIGPQNYVLRLYRETRTGYKPPDFDKITKKKKIEKVEDFKEMQFFSSEAPGNQQIRFRNIDPTQVKQIVVPSNVLMYNRFYDWPPEPEYARVYASPPPRNLATPGFADENDVNGYESDSAYIFDAASRNNVEVQKKKKKKGFQKVASKLKKGTRASLGFVENAGGYVFTGADNVVNKTTTTTVGAVKGTATMTKNVVKGTGKQTKSAAKGTANFLRLRRRKNTKNKYSDDEDEYY